LVFNRSRWFSLLRRDVAFLNQPLAIDLDQLVHADAGGKNPAGGIQDGC
jgi:hypothetical protein